MKRFNPYDFYRHGVSIHPLTTLSTEPVQLKEVVWTLYSAKAALISTFNSDVLSLPVTLGVAQSLFSALLSLIPDDFSKVEMDRRLSYELYNMKQEATKFETVFSAELQNASTYAVSKKGIYDTTDLIERADQALGEQASKIIVPEANADFAQAGKCMAFELPTASGFHAMRAAESVLRQYHRLLLGHPPNKRSPEMATCIDQLRKCGEAEKLLEPLDHIRDLHRNPLMHPEDFLTMVQALQLFDIAKSAICAMAVRIEEINKDPSLITTAKAQYAAAPKKKKKAP